MLSREESLRLKKEGMEKAARGRERLLEHTRYVARELARMNDTVTIDDVHEWYQRNKTIDIARYLGKALGSVFKGDFWEFTGSYVPTKRPTSHARPIKVWRLK